MYSVMRRVRNTKQPRGGYVPISRFTTTTLNDGKTLAEENISANLVGMAVDYLVRVLLGTEPEDAFKVSLAGAMRVGEKKTSEILLSEVKGNDGRSIRNACKLAGFDVCFRAGVAFYKPIDEIEPDEKTISNIQTMVSRAMGFWEVYGPIVSDGFTFQGGYTDIVSSGDGDYMTKDILWDFKVSKKPPTKNDSLQLLMYYLMGCRSIHPEFKNVLSLGIYNPRLNTIYQKRIEEIPIEVIERVSKDIIGYKDVVLLDRSE